MLQEHDDAAQDTELIKSVLQHIIDEMDKMDVERIHPSAKGPVAADVHVEGEVRPGDSHPGSNDVQPSDTDEQPGDQSGQGEDGDLNPDVLKELLDKAGSADDDGAMPEDHSDGLPPEIAALVASKKKKPLV